MGADLSQLRSDIELTSQRCLVEVWLHLGHFGARWDASFWSICWVVWSYNCSSRTPHAAATAWQATFTLSSYLHSPS